MPFRRPRGCVLWLDFLEPSGSVAYDKSGYGNHGTIHGAQRVRSLGRWGLEFDGVDDYVEVPHSDELNAQEFTWEILVLSKEIETAVFMCKGKSLGDRVQIWRRSASPLWRAGIWVGGEAYLLDYDVERLNEWVRFAFTYDGGEGRLYVDGELVDTFSAELAIDYGTHPLYIGQPDYSWHPSGYNFNGCIALVRIYNRALTPREVKANYAYFFSHLKGEV